MRLASWFSMLSSQTRSPHRSESRSRQRRSRYQSSRSGVKSRSRPESRSSHEEVDQTPLFLPAMCEGAEYLEPIMCDMTVKSLP